MLRLHVIQAQFGDCLLLEFGTAQHPRYVLVDGGPSGTYAADLQPALREIVGRGGKLDLVVLSHIDNDHIVGILDLFADLEESQASARSPEFSIANFWYNAFDRTIDPTGEVAQQLQSVMAMASVTMPATAGAFFGLREGNRLRLMAQKLGIARNKGFKSDLILVETARKAIKYGPLALTVAGPNRANLKALQSEWLEWLAATTERISSDPATAAMVDRSVPNLSSVVLLAECNGKTVLLTGDARGDHILDGLGAAGLAKRGRLHVDVLKVQHHGSHRNADEKFFRAVTADIYVLSANGRYGNPDFRTLQWIVNGARADNRRIILMATNETEGTKQLQAAFDAQTFGYTLLTLPSGRHSHAITLSA
jgi:beta-lactamase superfamily II metal-dependent hydrolase